MDKNFFNKKWFVFFGVLAIVLAGAFFVHVFNARSAGTLTNVFVGFNSTSTDSLLGQTNAKWKFVMKNETELAVGDVIQVDFPTISQGGQFSFSNPSVTATSSIKLFTNVSVGGGGSLRVAFTVFDTVAADTAFSITMDGVTNPLDGSLSNFQALTPFTIRTGTTTSGIATDNLTTIKDGPLAYSAGVNLTRGGFPITSDSNSDILLSDYSAAATGVNYTFSFTASTTIPIGGKIIINFPSNYDLTNATTTVQTDINGAGDGAPKIASGAVAIVNTNNRNRVELTTSNAATNHDDVITVVVSNITNPAQGVYRPLFIYTTNASGGLLDGMATPDGDTSGYSGPPPVDTIHIGGTNTLNVVVYKDNDDGTGTTTLSAADIAQIKIMVGCPDKQFSVGQKYLSAAATTTYSNLLDCNYKIGVMPAEGNSFSFFQSFLQPGMTDTPLNGSETKTVALVFGKPNATWQGTITGGVAAATGANIMAFDAKYMSFSPIFTDATYATQGFDGSGNGYFQLKVKTGSTWKINFEGGVLTSGGNKYWPPIISSTYASSTATTSLGSFAYRLANKTLTLTIKNSGTGETITSNACVGVKTTGGGFFMPAQETLCGANSGSNYVFKVPVGDITVEVMRPGVGKSEEYPVAITGDASKTINIAAPSSYITVTVRDSGGTVISGAPIFAQSGTGGFGQGITNTSGVATIYVASGSYRVEGFAPGMGPLTAQTGITVTDSSNPSVTFTVNTSGLKTISGTVTQNSVGIANVQIGARGYGSTSGGNGTVTNSDGTYTLRLPAGTYKVGGWSQGTGGLIDQTVDVSSSNVTGVNWSLGQSGTLRIIVSGGANVSPLFGGAFDPTTGRGNGSDTWVASSTTDKYVDLTLPAGTYEVHVASPVTGEITNAGGDTAVVAGGETTTKIYSVSGVATMVALTGTVTDGTDPVANANVWVSRINGPGFYSTLTGSDGTYTIKVPDEKTYNVGIKKLGYITTNAEVTMAGAKTQDFTLTAAGSTITGTISNSSGSAVASGWVSAKKTSSDTWTGGPTDASGAYSLDVDSGSSWTIYAEGPCFLRSTGLAASAGDSGKNITLSTMSGCSIPEPEIQGVTASSGGMVSNGEKMKIDIPANALGTGSDTVSVSVSDSSYAKDSNNATPLANSGQSITASYLSSGTQTSITSLNSKATITIQYEETDLPPGFNENNLQLGYFDTTTGQWEPVAATIDTDLNTMTAQVDHFTDYDPILPDVPTAPESVAASGASASAMSLTWTAVSGATYYDVYRSSTSGGTFTAVGSSTSASYTDSGLSAASTYYYKVTAVNTSGASAYSSEANGTTSAASSDVVDSGPSFSLGGNVGTIGLASTPSPSPSASPSPSPSASPAPCSSCHNDGTLIRYADSPKVYVIENGLKRWIQTAEIFNSLGYDWKKIIVVQSSETYQDGVAKTSSDTRSEGTLIRYAGSPKVYVLENGKKRWIPDAGTFTSLGYNWNKIIIVAGSETYTNGNDKTFAEKNAVAATMQFKRLLKKGTRGDDVTALQEKLKVLGFFPADIDATGYFGKTTEESVRKFQEANGLESVGYLGAKTREKLNGL